MKSKERIVGVSPCFRKCRLWVSEWLLFSFSENSNDAATTPVKRENNEDADSDFLSEDENKVDVKNEQDEVDVKTDPNVKLEGEEYSGRRKSETLDEFKQRWSQTLFSHALIFSIGWNKKKKDVLMFIGQNTQKKLWRYIVRDI